MGRWPEAPTAGEALKRIRAESRSDSEKGRWFENLVLRLIRDLPEFEVDSASTWGKWPDRSRLTNLPARDLGIDLVAVLKDGSIVAIQCKCYDEKHLVQKGDIDSFLSASAEPVFAQRWVVATTGMGRTATEYMDSLQKRPRLIDFHEYGPKPITGYRFRRTGRVPWELQRDAIADTARGLFSKDRGQLIMACGTGKTFVSLRVAEKIVPDGGTILFAAPSIALVSQARREWLTHAARLLSGLVVCSDGTSGGGGENEDIGISELVCRVSTDPEAIAGHMGRKSTTTVVFSTYQSLDKVCEAQSKHGAPQFDLIIADEAHRTTGVEADTWSQTIHDDAMLRGKKRLYMTATPRIYTAESKRAVAARGHAVSDMDDYDKFGTVLHRLSFKSAVNAGMLSDYRIIIMVARGGADLDNLYRLATAGDGDGREYALTREDVTRLLGTAMAANGVVYRKQGEGSSGKLPKVIGFANSIRRSKAFANLLNLKDLQGVVGRRAKAEGMDVGAQHGAGHLDGNSSALRRNEALRELEGAGPDSPRILCNVRLFTEGVDVPSLDAVVFMDPRDSRVDVVQAVGRVMRKAPGKKFGYIIIPVMLEPGKNVVESLESHPDGWKAVGQALEALQAHDGRLPDDPMRFIRVIDPTAAPPDPGLPPDDDGGVWADGITGLGEAAEKFYAKVVGASGVYRPGEAVADNIRYAVGHAAAVFAEAGRTGALAGALGLETGADGRGGESGTHACKIAALLVTNACMLHRRLQDHMPDLATLNNIGGKTDPGAALEAAWNAILERDYAPVFEPAVGVIRALGNGGDGDGSVNRAICLMADVANRAADSLSELGYDHAGPLYHRILDTAQSDSANYTDNVSALMLARMALSEDLVDWKDADAVRGLRVMDPACGTGTLLMAALKTIKERVEDAGGQTDGLHRALVEDSIYGLDINRHAAQLAACNLTLGAPDVDYQRINLHTLKHGPQSDGGVKAGSVEMLRAASGRDQMRALVNPVGAPDGSQQVDDSDVPIPTGGLDAVIMNPPFGSNVARSRKYPPDVVKQMQKNELDIQAELRRMDKTAGETIDSNSISTFFTPLADRLLDPKRGTLARVLAVTECTSTSALNVRKFLADRFHVERIITSHDPKRVNFSYKTSIHECLMICRRHNGGVKPPTEFVSLLHMPKNAAEAVEAADAIAGGNLLLGLTPASAAEAVEAADAIAGGNPEKWGTHAEWPADRVAAGDWTPVQWADPRMAKIISDLESSKKLEPLGSRYEIGPAGRQLRGGNFAACKEDTPGAVKCFWSISSELRRTIRASPEEWRLPADEAAKRQWKKRTNLFVAAKMDTISGRLTSLWSDQLSLGSGWIPVQANDETHGKALAVWLNSTPVRMMLLNRRSKKLTYPQWSLEHLRDLRIPVPDNPGWRVLRDAYDEVCDTELLPMKRGPKDPARAVIDAAAAKVLGVPPSKIAGWRRMLATEPSISNKYADQHDRADNHTQHAGPPDPPIPPSA